MITRYSFPEMAFIWSEENKFRKWLEIEIFACEAWAKLGVIPEEVLPVIRQRAGFDISAIKQLEEKNKHEVIAFLDCVAERVGEEAKYIHYGLTSSDVMDTALGTILKQSCLLIIQDLQTLADVLREKAKRYKGLPVIGRTHGVHAEPVTFGLKILLWLSEVERNILRLQQALEVISYGKISGAVGNYAYLDPFVEEYVCEKLGLKPAPISTQILQRDRHAHYLTALAIAASSLDKFALEIRNLQRTEILEVEEPFARDQKGSSAMPHKRNPIICERICGLARVIRANSMVALENIPLWHERDISHSSAERIILADSSILMDYITRKFIEVVKGLQVYPERMKENLQLTGGLIFSQRLLLLLVEKGMNRDQAYDIVQQLAMEAWNNRKSFQELVSQDERIREVMSEQELEQFFDYGHYLRIEDIIYSRFENL